MSGKWRTSINPNILPAARSPPTLQPCPWHPEMEFQYPTTPHSLPDPYSPPATAYNGRSRRAGPAHQRRILGYRRPNGLATFALDPQFFSVPQRKCFPLLSILWPGITLHSTPRRLHRLVRRPPDLPGQKALPGGDRRRLGASVRNLRRRTRPRERGDSPVCAREDHAHGARWGDEDFVADA